MALNLWAEPGIWGQGREVAGVSHPPGRPVLSSHWGDLLPSSPSCP